MVEHHKFFEHWKFWAEVLAATIAVMITIIGILKIFPLFASHEKLEGVVIDTAANPIAGVVVKIDLLPFVAETTTTQGGFIFKNVPGKPGDRVRVFATREGYKRRDQYFPLPGPARITMDPR